MRRLPILLALVVLAGVVWWLTRSPVDTLDLGPGVRLVTRADVEFVLVGNSAGAWRVVPAAATSPADSYPLPAGLRGHPVIDGRGFVHALHDEGVVRLRNGAFDDKIDLPTVPDGLSGAGQDIAVQGLVLVGVDGADQPVLAWRAADGPRLFVRDVEEPAWRLLEADGRPARPPEGAERAVVMSRARRALAFRTDAGWEAWLFGPGGVVRRVADGCTAQPAAFTPDGAALVVEGKVKGLWRLELDEDTLRFMADGNLGQHDRIPWSAGFRVLEAEEGRPTVMVAPQRDLHGYLQIFQTHLSGGGRWSFGGGYLHHYMPAVSGDGRLLAYVQSDFDASSTEPPLEDIYLMEFDQIEEPAVHVDRRRGGRRDQGPVFVGQDILFYIAGGRVKRLQPADD